jgi:hypothetical protein
MGSGERFSASGDTEKTTLKTGATRRFVAGSTNRCKCCFKNYIPRNGNWTSAWRKFKRSGGPSIDKINFLSPLHGIAFL